MKAPELNLSSKRTKVLRSVQILLTRMAELFSRPVAGNSGWDVSTRRSKGDSREMLLVARRKTESSSFPFSLSGDTTTAGRTLVALRSENG
jgi:hypothetical protein